MKNSFLSKAKQAPALATVLENKYDQRAHKAAVNSMAKYGYSTEKLKQFSDIVAQYNVKSGINSPWADFGEFRAYALTQKNGLSYFSDYKQKKPSNVFKRGTSEKEIRRAYVAYWLDRIVTEINDRSEYAEQLQSKHYKKYSSVVVPRLRLIKEGHTIKLGDIEAFINKHYERIKIASTSSSYERPKNKEFDKFKDIFLSNKKLGLTYFKNYDALYFNNIMRALLENNWNDALALVNQLIDQKRYSEIINAFEASGVTIKFIYDDSKIDDEQRKFVRELEKLL